MVNNSLFFLLTIQYYTPYNISKHIIWRIILYKEESMAFQLGGALLDACVLAVLEKEDAYGYKLTQEVREAIEVSESTLYPVLRRLQKDGALTTYDEPFQGRNRRYYKITQVGHEQLARYREEWKRYKLKVDSVLKGGKYGD